MEVLCYLLVDESRAFAWLSLGVRDQSVAVSCLILFAAYVLNRFEFRHLEIHGNTEERY